MPYRSGEGAVNRPASLHTQPNQIRAVAFLFCSVPQTDAPALPNHHASGPLIAALFFLGRPSDVVWPIASFVVLSLNGVPWAWARPDVRKEVLEAGITKITGIDVNSSPAVVLPLVVRGACRAANHVGPAIIFGAYLVSLLVAMLCAALDKFFGFDAAARAGGGKLGTARNGFTAAFATASPHANSFAVSVQPVLGSFGYRQAADLLSNMDARSWHA